MNTGILLSYKGLGANLLHLSYCHQIAKKFGPVEIITLSNKLDEAISDDPLIKKVTYLDKYHKKFTDIFKLSSFLKKNSFDNLFIFYPSLRFLLAAKLSKIDNIFIYPIFKKKNLHLVNAAKIFTEKNLNIDNCPTETSIFIDRIKKDKAKTIININKKNIVIGIGSSGPTTKWGFENYTKLIYELKKIDDYHFLILGGHEDSKDADMIVEEIGKQNCVSLCKMGISQIVPIISLCNLYIGNDSFGQHVACQCSVPSLILLFDSPRAYSDYSKNQYRILPEGIDIENINHDSTISPDRIKVDVVLKKAVSLLN